jgi:NAD(P)H-dependent FMN reductase
MSEHVARLVVAEVAKRQGVESALIDVRNIPLTSQNEGEDIKDTEFSSQCDRADTFVIVAPEYNHGYPGILKHALDTNLKEYIHKAVGIVGVSSGPFGGTRVVQNLLPVMRELGLVTIFWDGNFSRVHTCFDADGKLLDPAYPRRLDKFISELIWMGTVLRYGRENVTIS